MNVKQLIDKCDVTLLTDQYLNMNPVPIAEREDEARAFLDFLTRLKEIKPSVSENYVLVYKGYDGDKEFLNAAMFEASDIREKVQDVYEFDKILFPEDLSDEGFENLRGICNDFLHNNYAIDFIEWDRVLGFNTDEDTIKEYGVEAVAAAILTEMTFVSFYEEDIKVKRQEIDDTLSEVKELCVASLEERKLKDHELFEFKDNRTEEEKEVDRKKALKEYVLTTISMYKALKPVHKRLNG